MKTQNEKAKECWNQIGKVILGRSKTNSPDSVKVEPGCSQEDIMKMLKLRPK